MRNIDWKRILVPTDFSEGSKDALPYAVGVAREMGAALTLVYVVHTPPRAVLLASGVILEEKLLMQEAQKRLELFHEREILADIPIACAVLKGNPWDEITRVAADQKFDLIVMATHGRTGLKHFWFGSVAENVVRHAPCSVLTVRQQPIRAYLPGEISVPVKRVLAPIDFSELSLAALESTVALAEKFAARVDIIYVNQPPSYTDAEYANLFMTEPGLQESLEARMADVKEKIPGLKAVMGNFLIRVGSPAFEIVQAALILDSDLITIATHGHTGLKRLALGSTAEKVVRHATCPVLLVRN